ncbi:transglycosylase SLT domain-containing protein [Rhodoblastus sp.]
MRILGLDRRKMGAAFVATCCLTIPYVQHAPRRIGIPSLPVFFPPQTSPAPQGKADAAPPAAPAHDLSGVADALRYYGEGETLSGDAALTTKDPLVRDAVEWTLVRLHPDEAGLERIAAFLRAHPDWPAAQLRKRGEELAASEGARPERVAAYFAEFPPTTPVGRLAQAELWRNDPAHSQEAAKIARDLWRNADLGAALEKRLLKNFSGALSAADRIFRVDRLVLREQYAEAARAAQIAGKDGQGLFRAESDLAHGAPWAKVFPRAPAALHNDVGLLYLRIHAARHADRIDEAAGLMLSAPRDPAVLASPDDWWVERRLIARKFLDMGDARRAFRICAEAAPASEAANVEAEFTAGWIALRFLDDPALAAPHFDKLVEIARAPHSVARAAYWRGRVAEARGQDPKPFYARAANETETFYGQVARAKLGEEPVLLRPAPEPASGEARAEVVRAAELLFDLGQSDAGRQLALESAASLTAPEQMAALSQLIEARGDAHTALTAGKAAMGRGLAIDSLAFPLNGVPHYDELAKSVGRPVVLAIARQESAFSATAKSGAGAFGLMQMIEPTARKAAQSARIAFDENKLKNDPAFGAQLGAFHLGQLLDEYRGSYILAFAAYNAGGANVGEWIKQYGDPRNPNVDPIDWIERIPFTETRYYVQKIIENLHIYRARLDDPAPDLVTADLRQTAVARN